MIFAFFLYNFYPRYIIIECDKKKMNMNVIIICGVVVLFVKGCDCCFN